MPVNFGENAKALVIRSSTFFLPDTLLLRHSLPLTTDFCVKPHISEPDVGSFLSCSACVLADSIMSMSATPDATNDIHPFLPFPKEFEHVCTLHKSAYAINDTCARLDMLNATAAASGSLFTIRTPDFREYIPAINIAIVSSEESLPHGAAMTAFNPLTDIMRSALAMRHLKGLNVIQASVEQGLRDRQLLENEIVAHTLELEQLGPVEIPTAAQVAEISEDIFKTTPGKPPGVFMRRTQLKEALESARTSLANVKRQISARRMQAGVFILLKDTPWKDLPRKCSQSFDGNCGYLVFAPEVLRQLCKLRRVDLEACAATLHSTSTGSASPGNGTCDLLPGTWAILCGEKELWSDVFGRDAITESGLLQDFLFVEAGSEGAQCDPEAMRDLGRNTAWCEFLERLFERRQCEAGAILNFNVEGARQYLEFRRWCRSFASTLPVHIRPHFARWPQMAARIALSLRIMWNLVPYDVMPEKFLNAAIDFMKFYAPIQAKLLEKLMTVDSTAVKTEREMQRMLEKLRRRGPLSKRGIVRTYDKQDYGRIEELLELGVGRNLIGQRGPLFFAMAVSGSGVSAPEVLNFS